MSAILATGGLDDVAMAVGDAIIVGGFVVVSCLIACAWWKRSLNAAVIACVLILADGAFFQPWKVIAPSPPPDAYDAYWLINLRIISVIWSLLVIAAAACLVQVIRRGKQKRDRHIAA